jgi:hypothetical protein
VRASASTRSFFGRGARQPRVLAGRGIEFLLHAVARHAQFALLTVGELGGAFRCRRKLLLQEFDARARVAERAIPLGKLLRQKPVLGGEAVGPLLKSLPTGPGWRFFRSLFGRLRRGGGGRCRPSRSERRGAHGRRLTFLASDVGESLVELAGKPGTVVSGFQLGRDLRPHGQNVDS